MHDLNWKHPPQWVQEGASTLNNTCFGQQIPGFKLVGYVIPQGIA